MLSNIDFRKLMRVYLKDKHALAYFCQKATPEFWDVHWGIDDLRHYILSCTSDDLFIPLVKIYLSPGSTVLEGGCGRGHLVHALKYQEYNAIGIDFAKNTVQKIHEAVPELDIRLGDVRQLPIESESLDGYVSVGVIEHFWEGYYPILDEMRRTVKKGGFLFVSFPYMSPLRKFKLNVGGYPRLSSQQLENQRHIFYQFALTWQQVVHDLQKLGFILKETKPYDGIKGFKDEVIWFKPWLQLIYDGKTHQCIRPYLDAIFQSFASHCILLVMQKVL